MVNRRMDKVVADVEGVRTIVDDILIYAPTISILKKRSRAFLDQCRQHGVTLKQAKSQLAVTEVDFGGFRLSATGIQTSPDLLKSIKDFPRQRNLTGLRSWLVLVNQLGNFLFSQRMQSSSCSLDTTMPSLKKNLA